MEKAEIIKSLIKCVEACENLATASTRSSCNKMYKDCLSSALDCADMGMMLITKLNDLPDCLHRNLFKQFISYCGECINSCEKYCQPQASLALQACKSSMRDCELYISAHIQADEYYFLSPTSVRKVYTSQFEHAY